MGPPSSDLGSLTTARCLIFALWMSMGLCPQGLRPWSTVASGTRSRSRLAEASGPGSSIHHLSRDRGRLKGLAALQFSRPRRRSTGGGNNGTDSMELGSLRATDDGRLYPNSQPRLALAIAGYLLAAGRTGGLSRAFGAIFFDR